MRDSDKYSILIVGMFGIPSHIERFIRNLKQTNPVVSISLYSDRDKCEYSKDLFNYIDEYIQRKTWTGFPYKLWKFRKWFNLFAYIHQFSNMSQTHNYDIVNIHYPTYTLCYVMKYIKKMCKAVVVSPWGSDVLRVSDPKVKKSLSDVFRKSNYISVSSTSIFRKVLVEEMKIDEKKFYPLAWGSETIDYINEHLLDISMCEAKRQLNLTGRYLITCAYNAFEEQRHEIIINSINSRKKDLPQNTMLVFPVTYGSSYGTVKQEYVERLKKKCNELGMPAIFFEHYLTVPEIFLLRRATDMFIHIQTTDGGNSSLQEYVLCGAKVVHGAWIHYANLEKYEPLFYYPVYELDKLGDAIVDAYRAESINIPEQVVSYIKSRGWKEKMKQWNDFFISCKNR